MQSPRPRLSLMALYDRSTQKHAVTHRDDVCRIWVGSTYSPNEKAAVRDIFNVQRQVSGGLQPDFGGRANVGNNRIAEYLTDLLGLYQCKTLPALKRL